MLQMQMPPGADAKHRCRDLDSVKAETVAECECRGERKAVHVNY